MKLFDHSIFTLSLSDDVLRLLSGDIHMALKIRRFKRFQADL